MQYVPWLLLRPLCSFLAWRPLSHRCFIPEPTVAIACKYWSDSKLCRISRMLHQSMVTIWWSDSESLPHCSHATGNLGTLMRRWVLMSRFSKPRACVHSPVPFVRLARIEYIPRFCWFPYQNSCNLSLWALSCTLWMVGLNWTCNHIFVESLPNTP